MADRFSIIQEVQKFLTEAKELYFHGTSSNLAKNILSQGFTPDPKQKVWSQDKGHLASFVGSYFTQNVVTAISSASGAVKKFGGDCAIFFVQLETRTGLYDEDDITDVSYQVSQAYKDTVSRNNFVPSIARGLLKSDKYKSVVDLAITKWVSYYNKYDRGEYQQKLAGPALSRLEPLLRKWIETYILELSKVKDDFDSERFSAYPNANPAMRKAVNNVMNAMRGEVSRREKKPDSLHLGGLNIRIDSPIGFRGSNRILGLVTYPSDFRKDYNNDDDYVPFTVHYGEVPKKFLAAWENRMGYRYKLIKK